LSAEQALLEDICPHLQGLAYWYAHLSASF